jgi:outer membrane protein TolC
LLLAGCKGTQTSDERHARAQAQALASSYRPRGQKPALPLLTTNSNLRDFLTYAMLNQPRVEAAYYDWLASVERITTARSLPDPQLTFQMDIQNIVTSVMPGLMMNFPGAGKLRAGAKVASAESEVKYYAFESSVIESAFELKRAYYQLYFLEEKIRVNRDTLALLADLEILARAQNEVGKVTLQDVLRAQIEQDRLRTDLANVQDSRSSLLAEFKAALGLSAEQPAPPLPRAFESTPLDLSSGKLLETAFATNSRLKSMEAEVRVAEAAIELAAKSRRPDSSAGLMADVKTSPVLYRPTASISLPIWRDKIAAQIAEAQANKKAAQARLSAEQIALAVDFAQKSFLFRETSRNLVLLHEQLLPKARQSLEVARIGYLSGRLDFFNLSDTERTLLGFQLDEVEARTQREMLLAEISLLIRGLPPGNAPMRSSGGGMKQGSPGAPMKTKGAM